MSPTLNPGVEFAKPWKDGNRSAYHVATSIEAAAEGFKRCRNTQHFILTDEGVERGNGCTGCGQTLTVERGNRCEYNPRSKGFKLYHYDCAWGAVFQDLEVLLERS